MKPMLLTVLLPLIPVTATAQEPLFDALAELTIEPECGCAHLEDQRCDERGDRPERGARHLYDYDTPSLRQDIVDLDGWVGAYEGRFLPEGTPSDFPHGGGKRCKRNMVDDLDAGYHCLHVEHVVAITEAHDSGGCEWTNDRRAKFATDLQNLTLATSTLNGAKWEKDAADWTPEDAGYPEANCWFAETVISVKTEWGLSVDQDEADALALLLEDCL